MAVARRILNINSSQSYSHVPPDEVDLSALQPWPDNRLGFTSISTIQQTLPRTSTSFGSSTSARINVHSGRKSKRRPRAILVPQILIQSCLLSPSAVLLVLTIHYRVDIGTSLFQISEIRTGQLYVNLSVSILTNLSSVSSTLAPFLIAVIMEIWSPFVARALLKASQENPDISRPLPTPDQFSILANMRAGRCDQIWRYFTHRRLGPRARPSILRQTAVVLFLSLFMAFLTFLGDQFFHVWSESVNIHRYSTPEMPSSLGRGLSSDCLSLVRRDNYGWPCTRSGSISQQEFAKRENDVSYIAANTSEINQIRFETASDLPQGDLALLYPAPSVIPLNLNHRASTLGVSTQCRFMTPICKVKHIGDILTQFNCSDTFFGVLGKPANTTYNMASKAQDPDVPGLAWKISPSLQYGFYSDEDYQFPYNTMGYNPSTGNFDPDLPLLPDSDLVNPVFLAVAGRISNFDMAADSTFNSKAAGDSFVSTYNGRMFDFFLNCSYTTYNVEYTVVNGTTRPDFTFTPTLNGSVAEEWHGRQEYIDFDGDPSSGLGRSAITAAKQKTPEDFARTWANLYSVRVLAVIGGYTDARPNIEEQFRDPMLVTRIVPWTLYFLLLANVTYALLGMVVGAVAWFVSTGEVLKVAENMDLNKQIVEKYGGVEMKELGDDGGRMGVAEGLAEWREGIRVGVVGDSFGSLYYAI